MASHLDLAEASDRSPSYVLQWLRQRGYGGRPGAVSQAAQEAYFFAHPKGPSPFDERARPPPPPPPEARMQATPLQPVRTAQVQESERYYKKQAAALLATLREQQERYDALKQSEAQLRAQLEARPAQPAPPKAEPSPPKPRPSARPEEAARDLRQILEAQGIAQADWAQAIEALLQRAQREGTLPQLLASWRTAQGAAFEQLAPVCALATCVTAARARGLLTVPASRLALCVVCRGEPSRRAFAQMLQVLSEAERTRLLIVGAPGALRAQVAALGEEMPGLALSWIAAQDAAVSEKQVDRLRKKNDVLVLWGASELPQVWAQRGLQHLGWAQGCRLAKVAPEATRDGLEALCQAVVQATLTSAPR